MKKIKTIFSKKKLPIITGVVLALVVATFLIGAINNSLSDGTTIKVVSAKEVFRSVENPQFVFVYKKQANIFSRFFASVVDLFTNENKEISATVKILNAKGEEVDGLNQRIKEESGGKFSVDLDHSKFQQELRPGKYRVELEIIDGENAYIQEQDFMWGVLAINTNKSIYTPDEKAYLQMAVLNDGGKTICDANLKLKIENEKGKAEELSTEDGTIKYSGKCFGDNVTDVPDYFAHYQVSDPGKYKMKLTNLDNGFEIIDYFEVQESVPFDIERIGPTRIWPYANYEMKIKIKANQDFSGEIIEAVPMTFKISGENIFKKDSHVESSSKEIFWQVNLKAGQVYELEYKFDAPNISPYLYLLGPLRIGDFKELRQWKIAGDADLVVSVEYFQISLSGTATSNYGVLSKSQTIANCVPFVTWSISGTSELMGEYQFAKVTIENVSGEDRVIVSRYAGVSGTDLVAEAYIVEFNPSAADVNTGPFSMAAATDSTTANPGLTDISNAFLLSYYTQSDGDDEFDNNMMRARITSTTNISFDRYSTSAYGAVDGQWYTVEALNEEFTVQRNTLVMGASDATNYQDLSPEVSMGKSFLIFSHDTAETSDDTRDATMRMTLTDTDDDGNAETVVGDAGNGGTPSIATKDADWEVVTFAESYDAAVQRGVFSFTTLTEASDDTLTTFNADYTIPWGTHMMSQGEGNATTGTSTIPGNFFRLDLPDTHTVRGTRGGTGGSSDLSWQVIEWMHNNSPDAPDVAEIPTFANMETNDTTPVFGDFSANDNETEDVEFEIQIDDDYEFGSVATTAYSYNYGDGDTGWSAATFSSGASTSYTLEDDDALSNGTTYWWRVRARDPAGSDNWGEYSEPRSITINTSLSTDQWLQTTDEQFDTGTPDGTRTTGSGSVEIGTSETQFVRANASAGSLSTTLDIGGAGMNRLVAVFAFSEADGATALSGVTVDSKVCNIVAAALNDDATKNRTELWYCDESDLGSSNGSVTITISGTGITAANWAVHAQLFTGISQSGPTDFGTDTTSLTPTTTATVTGIDVSAGGIVVMGVSNGTQALTASWPSPLTEKSDADPSSADAVTASGIEVSAQSDKTYQVTWSAAPNRSSGVAASWDAAPVSSGTIESPQIDYSWVNVGDYGWDEVIVGANTDNGSIEIDILDENGGDTGLGCTITGDSCTIDISSLDPDVDETQISILATLNDSGGTPYLESWTVTWATAGGGTANVSQAHYRWREDNNGETNADWKRPEDAIHSGQASLENVRLRFSIKNTGDAAATNYQFGLQVAPRSGNGCSSVASSSYNTVPLSGSCGTAVACMNNSSNFTQGDSTTAQLTAEGTWVGGEMTDTASISDAITINTDYYTEVEFNFQMTDNADYGAGYCFRITKNGALLNTYTKIAEIFMEGTNLINRLKGSIRIFGGTLFR